MIQAQEKAHYTPEEYLALETEAQEQHEYWMEPLSQGSAARLIKT
ncbi:MAG: hypothetical protein Fur0046_34410 [Cyanobacteria bacterium J069]